ncbi:zinc finger protein 252 [Astyanax mexicanus]|uniref:zinc finger protein 252 n=1 Tax=Astyanax mexicanus TaxID=7994 RepID=UPI0020CB16AF|nr:zinc finger protein 252 [Astyanax mexicanus]
MTQMDLLVTNVAELLATAVHEVLRLMGQAVSEYQEESAKMRQENQKLQQKLEELRNRLDISDAVQQVSSSGAAEESSFEVRHEQVLDYRLEQGPLVSEEEEEGSGPQNLSFKEEKPTQIQLEPEDPHRNSPLHSKSNSPTCNKPLKRRRPFSRFRKSSPTSPNNHAAPENNEFETAHCVNLNNIKLESGSEPPECARSSQSDDVAEINNVFNTSDDNMPLEYGQNHQLYSPDHNEPVYITQDQYEHMLSSRVENILDFPNQSHLSLRREGSHACHICGKTFATSSSLGAHFVCHSNERPFACKCCNFRFSRLADLKKHERIHTGERPYNCTLCGRRFNRTENLRRHLRKVHHGAMI